MADIRLMHTANTGMITEVFRILEKSYYNNTKEAIQGFLTIDS
jgi:hypothetical protein